jgi:hypothetical protein
VQSSTVTGFSVFKLCTVTGFMSGLDSEIQLAVQALGNIGFRLKKRIRLRGFRVVAGNSIE